MADNKDNSVSSEVEDRLEELFMEDDEPMGEDFGENGDVTDDRLREIKAAVLSMDWEINDDTLAKLLEQVKQLSSEYKDDRILLMFLQLLGSIAKYIQNNRVNAHPDSIKLLGSVYRSFEKTAVSEGMPEAERKKLLQEEVARFKELKKQIASKKGVPAKDKKPQKPAAEKPKPETAAPPQVEEKPDEAPVEKADVQLSAESKAILEQLQKTIREEFRLLRKELKTIIESK